MRTYYCRISKISYQVGRNDNFLAKARKLSILPTSLDSFDIQQHYIRISIQTNNREKILFSKTLGDPVIKHHSCIW